MRFVIHDCTEQEFNQAAKLLQTVFDSVVVQLGDGEKADNTSGTKIRVGDIVVWDANRRYLYRVMKVTKQGAEIDAVAVLRTDWKTTLDAHGLASIKHYMGTLNGFQVLRNLQKVSELHRADLTAKLKDRISEIK
jgi:hypothetical protein